MKLPRLWICTMIAASLPSVANPLPAQAQALQQVAGDRMLIGAAVPAHDLDNPQLATLIAGQFGCITAGNEFKPESLQREPGMFTFAPADRIAEFAQQHNMKMIGHTLLWHNQAPAWLFVDQNK